MITQRIASSLLQLPSANEELVTASTSFQSSKNLDTEEDLIAISVISRKLWASLDKKPKRVNLLTFETQISQAKHAATELEDDFV